MKIGAGAAAVLLVLVLFVATRSGDSGAATPAPVPQVLSGPTTSTTPNIDPLANLGVLNPTAAALVGQTFDARRELARRASETMTQAGVDQCRLVIGANSTGTWEISTVWGPAHPVVLMAGCAFPPVTTPKTTTTVGATS